MTCTTTQGGTSALMDFNTDKLNNEVNCLPFLFSLYFLLYICIVNATAESTRNHCHICSFVSRVDRQKTTSIEVSIRNNEFFVMILLF